MSTPWTNEPTPEMDAVIQQEKDTIHHCKVWDGLCTKAIADRARDLERRLRHAEGLLREHKRMWGNPMVYGDHLEWMKRKDTYLAAAEREGSR